MDGLSVEKFCEAVGRLSEERKSEACRVNRGVSDTNSFLSVAYCDDVMAMENEATGNPITNLPQELDRIIKLGLMKFDALAFTAEVFMKPLTEMSKDEAERIAKEYKRGDLEKEYKMNPLTDVVEGLFTVAISWEGETAFRFVEVKYDDRGQPVFVSRESNSNDPQAKLSASCLLILDDYRNYCRNELATEGGKEYEEAFHELYVDKGNLKDALSYLKELMNRPNPNLN